MMTSILFVAADAGSDRAGNGALDRLVVALDRAKYRIGVVVPGERATELEGYRGVDIWPCAVPVVDRSWLWNPLRMIRGLLGIAKLRKLVQATGPRIIYIDDVDQLPALHWAAFGTGARILWHAQSALATKFDRAAMRWADVAVIASETVEQRLQHLAGRARRIRISNAIDTNRFHPAYEHTTRRFIRRLVLETVVLYAGPVDEDAGLKGLMAALQTLRARGFPMRLWVVGQGDKRVLQELKELAVEFELSASIDWMGIRKDIEDLLRACDMFVYPRHAGEETPLALLEAMATGLPCVGTDIPGVRELLRDGTGLLVPVGDSNGLSEAIGRLIRFEALGTEMGNLARQRIVSHHSPENYVRAFDQVFSSLSHDAGEARSKELPSAGV